VELWLTHLRGKGLAHGTILSHLSAIRHHCLRHNVPTDASAPRVRLLLQGIKKDSRKAARTKAVVSKSHLRRLIAASESVLDEEQHYRFVAMVTLAFYACLRPSELCSSAAGHDLKWRDIKLGKKARSVRVTLRTYKHSSAHGKVKVAALGTGSCPVSNLCRYMTRHGEMEGAAPLFDVTVQEFRATLEDVRLAASIRTHLTPHCFRHGGATWAANQGWPDARIKAHGRWKSDAYKRYVHAR
jgi:integrase